MNKKSRPSQYIIVSFLCLTIIASGGDILMTLLPLLLCSESAAPTRLTASTCFVLVKFMDT